MSQAETKKVKNVVRTSDDGIVCTIERKDYAEFLSQLDERSVDLVLTDPPYTISKKTGFANVGKNSVERFAVSMDFGKWDHVQIDLDKMAASIYRVLRQGGTAIIWYDIWKLSYLADAMVAAGFKMLRVLIWEKTNPVPLNQKAGYLSNSREYAVVGVRGGNATFHSGYDNGVYHQPIPRHKGKKVHPTQKPLDLFCELVEKHSNKGDLVVDCFLGGGTTAEAAISTGRRFAGCDKDINYVRASRKRVKPFNMTKSRLFLELAKPDKKGFSRKVFVDEFVDGYSKLQLKNGGSWCRGDSMLRKEYNVVRGKEKGRVTYIQLQGYKK